MVRLHRTESVQAEAGCRKKVTEKCCNLEVGHLDPVNDDGGCDCGDDGGGDEIAAE